MIKVGAGSLNDFLKSKSAPVAALPAPAPGLTVSPAVPKVPEPVSPLQSVTSVAADGNGLLSEVNSLGKTILDIMQTLEKFGITKSMQRKIDGVQGASSSRPPDIDYDILAERVASRLQPSTAASPVATVSAPPQQHAIDWTLQAQAAYSWLMSTLIYVEERNKSATIAELIESCQARRQDLIRTLIQVFWKTQIQSTTSNANTAGTGSTPEKTEISNPSSSASSSGSSTTQTPNWAEKKETSSSTDAQSPKPSEQITKTTSTDSNPSISQQ